jgi:hypothetical protein
MDKLGNEAALIYERPIIVRGVNDESVTYSFKLSAMTEGAVGAGLRILLKRVTSSQQIQNDTDPFACLLDHSCQETRLSNKNH